MHVVGVAFRTRWLYGRAVEHLVNAGRFRCAGEENDFSIHTASAHMTVATYCIPVAGVDDQTPHVEDEVYVVTAGRGRFEAAGAVIDVAPGSVLFVPAEEPHRFFDVVEDLAVLVVFAPPYQR